MQDFRNLIAWQKASALEARLDEFLPRIAKRKQGLADQIERAVSSIPANIAEGCGRESKADFRRFLTNAVGSSTELENHLLRAHRLGLLSAADTESLVADTIEVRKIIYGLRKSLG